MFASPCSPANANVMVSARENATTKKSIAWKTFLKKVRKPKTASKMRFSAMKMQVMNIDEASNTL